MGALLKNFWLLMCCLPVLAFAQWQWIDPSGRPVFSDLPPPPSITDAQIIKRPAPPAQPTAPDPSTPKPVATVATEKTSPSVSSLDAAVKAKRAEEQRQQALQEATNAARVSAAKAENCRRAQQSLAVLMTGSRLRTVNSQGESVFMDESSRLAEKSRIENIIRSDC